MRHRLALDLTIVVFLAGCASYEPRTAPVPEAGAMRAWRTEGALAVGADPYVELERQKAVFDADLTEEGVLPIQVFVQNRGERKVLVRASDIVLALSDGREITPQGASAVAAKLEKRQMHFWPTFFLGLPGAIASSAVSDKARTDRQADYRSKELQEVTLRQDNSAHGFIYFIIPAPATPAFTEATLKVRFIDAEEATSVTVALRLSGLRRQEK